MCQGVIGVMVSQTNAIHWGTGSHTELIKKLWPNSKESAGDNLIRFECKLREGPGKFQIEGGNCAADQKALIEKALLVRCGDIEGILKHVEEVESFDFAIGEGLLTGPAYTEFYKFWNSNEIYKLHTTSQFDRAYFVENEISKLRYNVQDRICTSVVAIQKHYAKILGDTLKPYVNSNTESYYITILDVAQRNVEECNKMIALAKQSIEAEVALMKIPGINSDVMKKINATADERQAKSNLTKKEITTKVVAKIRELAAKYPNDVRTCWQSKNTKVAKLSDFKPHRASNGRFAPKV